MARRKLTPKTAAYCILSVDGGGIRGLYAAVLLDRLIREVPTLVDGVDLVTGTSTGGIIALGLAHGLAPSDLVALYRDRAREIFDDSWLDDLKDLGGLTGADYDNDKLKTLMEDVFGKKTRLKQLKKRVLVPTFDLDNESPDPGKRMWKPKFFHNYPGPDSDVGALMVDGMMGVADYQSARLLQHRYFRLAPILPERIGLDDVDKIADLIKDAQDVDIRGAVAWLTRYFSPARIDNSTRL